ncbi:MAG: ribonuclease P protein component [Thermodesulfovibrio sp. RBG_19FT_COMBO_42_12]|nr:MAG: ribonuclease P protein component [Thermodesulfovibrio sp. RBG_19FT_COMBO_42_12]
MRSLTKKRDFQLVFKEGITFASKYLVVYARPNILGVNRLGLSISKKVGIAVTRNKIKRLLRDVMRRLLEEFPLNYDFIIIARKPSVEGRLDDFIRDIKSFLSRLFHEKSSHTPDKAL